MSLTNTFNGLLNEVLGHLTTIATRLLDASLATVFEKLQGKLDIFSHECFIANNISISIFNFQLPIQEIKLEYVPYICGMSLCSLLVKNEGNLMVGYVRPLNNNESSVESTLKRFYGLISPAILQEIRDYFTYNRLNLVAIDWSGPGTLQG